LGLVSISSFKKDIVHTEDDAISTGVGYVLPETSVHSELAPLYYVHEFDSRIEYMNKIAKLLNPWLAYGMWQKDNTRAAFGNELWVPFMPLIITDEVTDEFAASRLASRTLLRFNEPHREHGIPRRVRWFENGIMETR